MDKLSSRQLNIGAHILFVVLFIYVIIRSVTVFYIHDEIITKNGYMMDWNFLPYSGYVDANNHFLLSFLGGLFYRIFNSDAIWVFRLPSVLAFPLFYYSIYGFRRFLNKKSSIAFILLSISLTVFLLEFFGLARGYAMSLAFLTFALLNTCITFKENSRKSSILASISWVLAIYSNLSFLPLALFGILYLAVFNYVKKDRLSLFVSLGTLIPFAVAIKYSLDLQQGGKLYLGSDSDFYGTTVHSLTKYVWMGEGIYLDIVVTLLAGIIVGSLAFNLLKLKKLFRAKNTLMIFFTVGLVGVMLQNLVFGINYPENRAAAYFIILFYGSLAFLIDRIQAKWISFPFLAATITVFLFNINISHSMFFYYEHVDEELFTLIPDEVNGIPTATGARFWQLDEAFTKNLNYPMKAFQLADSSADTLSDYIIQLDKERPDIREVYRAIHVDEISGLTLFERNQFLPRKLDKEFSTDFNGTQSFIDLAPAFSAFPAFIRCKGVGYNVSQQSSFQIVFSVEDADTREKYSYGGVVPTSAIKVNEADEVHFDFTYTIDRFPPGSIVKSYIFNPDQLQIQGHIDLAVYRIPGISTNE